MLTLFFLVWVPLFKRAHSDHGEKIQCHKKLLKEDGMLNLEKGKPQRETDGSLQIGEDHASEKA